MKNHYKATSWIVGILLASLMFAAFISFNILIYSGSDDAPILRYYMGFEGGEPTTFSTLIHPVLGWVLYGLARLLPGVAWFSGFQLFFLWFSSVVVVKSLMRCAVLHGRSQWLGAFLGALTIAAGAFWISMRISFTTTAAWLGAAAVIQLACVDWAQGSKRSIRRGLTLSIALLLACYFLRQVSVLPPLAFWLLGLLIVWLTHRGQVNRSLLRPLLAGVAVCAALLLGLTGVRTLETKLLKVEDLYAWNDASGKILDYSDTMNVIPTDEALDESGLSREEYKMFTYWYFMEDHLTADNINRLYENTFQSAEQTISAQLNGALKQMTDTIKGTPSQAYGILFSVTAAVLSLILAALFGFQKPLLWIGSLAVPLLGFLLLGYLCWEGRMPMRAMLSVTLPMMTLSMWLFVCSLEPLVTARVRNVLALALCILLLYPAVQGAVYAWNESQKTLQAVRKEMEINETPVAEDLDMYTADDPDTLFIYDLSLVLDYRLFPKMPEELSGNAVFWGGHHARSPGWYRALQKYGITALNGAIFLRDDVLMASVNAEPWPGLTDYISSQIQAEIDWEYVDSYGSINIFRFYVIH